MAISQRFKTQMQSGKPLVGTLLTLPSPQIAEIMAQVGFDWLMIDMEHSTIDLATAQTMVQAATAKSCCLIRVRWNDSAVIKQALDIGCDGVIIPQILSAEEALAAVAACKYPPLGIRSLGIDRAQGYGMTLLESAIGANDSIAVILHVEHIEAVNRIEAILEVAGIDGIFVGPYDLSASMGLIGDVANHGVQKAIETVRVACEDRGVPIGIFATDAEAAGRYIVNGFQFVVLGGDILYLGCGGQQAMQTVRSFTSLTHSVNPTKSNDCA